MEKKYIKLRLKYLFIAANLLLFISSANAQTRGTGCRIGDNVYTEYLGMTSYYGNPNDKVSVYRANGIRLIVVNGQGYSGYQCGKINVYEGGSRYNSSTNSNEWYPAVNEVLGTVSSASCMVSNNVNTSSGGKGDIIKFEINNPQYCSSRPINAPLDNYIWVLIFAVGGIGAYLISKKGQLI